MESTEESGVPKFKDPDVQKFAEAYAELAREYESITPEKSASDPKEDEKFSKYKQKVSTEIQEKITKQ